MNTPAHLSPAAGRTEFPRLCFNGLSFPILPSLNYQPDGPDKEKPDRLFIEDKAGRFLFYFETGSGKKEVLWPSLKDRGRIDILHGNKQIQLCYPLQAEKPEICVGYFSIRFTDGPQSGLCSYGELSIHPPEPYLRGLGKYEDIYTLFSALTPTQE